MAEAVATMVATATIVSGVVAGKQLVYEPIKDAFNISWDVADIHIKLKESMHNLLTIKENHEKTLASWKSTKKPSVAYNNWIQEVSNIDIYVAELDKKYEKKTNKFKCIQSFRCVNLCKKMKKAAKVVAQLESKQLGDILSRKEPEKVVELKEAPDIKNYPTLFNPLFSILGLLKKPKFKVIAIRGIMGTGKTSIMQNLNNDEDVGKMFEMVVWVDVSTEYSATNFSIIQMQKDILHRLNLDYAEGTTIEEFAKRINRELQNKKCLLLLDGVNEDMKFSKIGIDLNYKNGSKLVFTSRKDGLCDCTIDRVIRLGKLTDDEAMHMFTKILGQTPRNPRVVEFCDNLPFVIKMIASAFKKRETYESWVQGYKNLSIFPNEGDDAIKKVYNYLDFCCTGLDETQKNCFLYCALYPGGMEIGADSLLDCWGAENLYATNNVREHGRHVLNELKKVSLLEEHLSKNGEYVKMRKMIRKVALDKLVADINCKHLVKVGESLQDLPEMEKWHEMHRISLVDNKITNLSRCPDCPLLYTLLLQRNASLNKIDNSFFENTKSLRILDLCGTGITSLPMSLCKLKLLKVLYLNDCTNLVRLPSEIGKLENLEVLDVRGIRDANVPSQNEGILESFLNKFRRLKVTPCTPLTNIDKMHKLKRLLVSFNVLGNENDAQYVSDYCNVISQASTTLEELVIDVKSYKQRCSEMINIVREKVTTMPKLTSLKFCFEDGVEDVIKVVTGISQTKYTAANELTNFVSKLDDSTSNSFQLFIGCSISSLPQILKCDNQRYTKYCKGTSSDLTNINKVLGVTEAFELVNHNDLINVSEFGNESLNKIQSCLIEGCSKITGIANGDSVSDPLLESVLRLYIKNLVNLECIWKKAPHPLSLSKLRTLHVEDCPITEALLVEPDTNSILPCLRKLVLVNLPKLTRISTEELPSWPLEELKIQKCPKLVEFPFTEDNTNKLKKLILDEMSILKLICVYESLEWPALEKLKIHGCPSLAELPFNNNNANNLMLLKVERIWWEGLLWKDQTVKTRLKNYCSFQEDSTPIIGSGP